MSDLFDPLPESPGTRRKENTRARLVRASLDVFVDEGIDGATVDDLVRAAGFTRGAFYSNFSSKEEVFSALFATVTEELLGIARTSVEEAMGRATTEPGLDDAAALIAVFEAIRPFGRQRSEERRVGKECRSGWGQYHFKQKTAYEMAT